MTVIHGGRIAASGPMVLLGHYAWALESFLATALAGTAVSALLARAEGLPFAAAT